MGDGGKGENGFLPALDWQFESQSRDLEGERIWREV
jgi:hypothetical protein